MISESKGASSCGKINKLKAPQLPSLHRAEQGKEQVAAKYKQIFIASRFAAPPQVHRNVNLREPHTVKYFQAVVIPSEYS